MVGGGRISRSLVAAGRAGGIWIAGMVRLMGVARLGGEEGLWEWAAKHASKLNPTLSSYPKPLRIAACAAARNNSQGF